MEIRIIYRKFDGYSFPKEWLYFPFVLVKIHLSRVDFFIYLSELIETYFSRLPYIVINRSFHTHFFPLF